MPEAPDTYKEPNCWSPMVSTIEGFHYTDQLYFFINSLGVPSRPTQPNITAWGEEFAVIDTLVPKIGSSINFSVTTILLLNGTEVARQTESRSDIDSGTEFTELELVFSNLSYRGEWQFQVMASNVLGNSEYSLPSNPGWLCIIENTMQYDNMTAAYSHQCSQWGFHGFHGTPFEELPSHVLSKSVQRCYGPH